MKTRALVAYRRISVLALLAGLGIGANHALAADKPPVLGAVAEVYDWTENPATPNTDPQFHPHKGLEKWKLKKGQEFEIHRKLLGRRARFFDRHWDAFSEMQDPDLLIVNPDSPPLSIASGDNAAFANSIVSRDTRVPQIEDFFYAFGIYKLENHDGSKTAHALIYLPLRVDPKTDPYKADWYFLLIYHIQNTDAECDTNNEYDPWKKFCRHLRSLSYKWSSGFYTDKGLAHEISVEIHAWLQEVIDGSSSFGAAPALVGGLTFNPTFAAQLAGRLVIMDHNGVIHGLLKN